MSSILLRLAVLPSIGLLLLVVGKNKQRRNPTNLLVILAVLGAVSCIPAAIGELIGMTVLERTDLYQDSIVYGIVEYFCVVAAMEELVKFIAVLIATWKNKNFDHSYDGIIYGVCSALGFATLENILYVLPGGLGLGVIRAISSVPLHCTCGVFMGYFYAKAKENANHDEGSGVAANMFLAYLVPVFIHGLYDFIVTREFMNIGYIIVVVFVIAFVLMMMLLHAAKVDHIISNQPIWSDPYTFRRPAWNNGQWVNNWNYNQYNGNQRQPGYGRQNRQMSQGMPGQQRTPYGGNYRQGSSYGVSNQPGAYGMNNQRNGYGTNNQPGAYGMNNQQNLYGTNNQPGAYGMNSQQRTQYGRNQQQGPYGMQTQQNLYGGAHQPGIYDDSYWQGRYQNRK